MQGEVLQANRPGRALEKAGARGKSRDGWDAGTALVLHGLGPWQVTAPSSTRDGARSAWSTQLCKDGVQLPYP